MKLNFLKILFIFFILSNAHAVDIGDTAPNWQLKNGYGENVDFYRDTHDKVSVLIYWASWCPYCASLMPHLQELANEYSDNNEVVFFAMNINETADPKRHMQEQGYSFDLIMNADPTMDDYNVPGTPNIFVIDKYNKVVFRRVPDTPDVDVKNGVQKAIAAALN